MRWIQLLKLSLLLPYKKAMFQLNRVRMGTTIGYTFMLMGVVSLPRVARFLLSPELQPENSVPPTLFILQFFVFYYLVVAFAGLLAISGLALAGLMIRQALQRKLTYLQLWKMAAYAATWPVLIYTVSESLQINGWLFPVFLFAWFLVSFTRMILHLPKKGQGAIPHDS